MVATIKQVDPLAAYRELRDDIDAAVSRVLDSGWYILGREVSAFESELAQQVGLEHCLGVGTGTDAIVLGLRSLEVGAGDVVIAPSHTAVATVAAIELAGATPLLIDINPETYTVDPQKLEDTIRKGCDSGGQIKAVIAVHLYGHPAAIVEIVDIARRYNLVVIEDCAQAQGATCRGAQVGSFADVAAFSFYPTKNLGAIGDGGALLIREAEVAARATELRQYGWRERFVSHSAGMNSRLDELQAAILRVKLRHLGRYNSQRCDIAMRYAGGLSDALISLPATREDVGHVFHQYVVRCSHRDELLGRLAEAEIGFAIHYPFPVHMQPAYAGRVAIGCGGMENTEMVAREIVSLPMYPQLTDPEVDRVCLVLNEWCESMGH
jgi:dTDP-4-amino-4,6-dideoxygalactose transaminase